MAYPVPQPVATEQTVTQLSVGGGTTVTINTIADGVAPNNLIVINWIKFSGQSSAGTPIFTLAVAGTTIARKTMTSGVVDEVFNLNFSAGWPIWASPPSDLTPATSVTVVVTGSATVSNVVLSVGYSYVPSSLYRSS